MYIYIYIYIAPQKRKGSDKSMEMVEWWGHHGSGTSSHGRFTAMRAAIVHPRPIWRFPKNPGSTGWFITHHGSVCMVKIDANI